MVGFIGALPGILSGGASIISSLSGMFNQGLSQRKAAALNFQYGRKMAEWNHVHDLEKMDYQLDQQKDLMGVQQGYDYDNALLAARLNRKASDYEWRKTEENQYANYLRNRRQQLFDLGEAPSLQVEGLRKAGINPAAAFGAVSSGGGSTGGGPSVGPMSFGGGSAPGAPGAAPSSGSIPSLVQGMQDSEVFADVAATAAGLGDIAQSILGDPVQDKRDELETRILEKRLELLNQGMKTQERGLKMVSRSDEATPGEALSTWEPRTGESGSYLVPTKLKNGRTVWGANPEGPDMDQALWAHGMEWWHGKGPKIDEEPIMPWLFGGSEPMPNRSKPKQTYHTGETW
jgi:hypothetical protein